MIYKPRFKEPFENKIGEQVENKLGALENKIREKVANRM